MLTRLLEFYSSYKNFRPKRTATWMKSNIGIKLSAPFPLGSLYITFYICGSTLTALSGHIKMKNICCVSPNLDHVSTEVDACIAQTQHRYINRTLHVEIAHRYASFFECFGISSAPPSQDSNLQRNSNCVRAWIKCRASRDSNHEPSSVQATALGKEYFLKIFVVFSYGGERRRMDEQVEVKLAP